MLHAFLCFRSLQLTSATNVHKLSQLHLVCWTTAVEAVCPCRELEQHRLVPTSWKDLISSLPLPLRVMVYPDLSKYYSLFGHQQLTS